MRVVLASSEAAPLAKTGGLADVVGALPGVLRRLGLDVSVVLPAFRGAAQRSGAVPSGRRVLVPLSGDTIEAEIERGALPDGTPVDLIRYDPYFDRDSLYGTAAGDYSDNAARFAFFSRAVLALLADGEAPHVLHCHDWQSALAIAFLRADVSRYPSLTRTRTLLTVHNLGYQGVFWALDWHLLNLDFAYFTPRRFEFHAHINYLKAGLVFADAINTVSRRYAEEITTPEFGFGLEGVLQERRADLHGILNGVDYNLWSPDIDTYLPARFDTADRRGKAKCKHELQHECGLAAEADTPLLCIVSRLAEQKGLDLLLQVGPALAQRRLQLVVLGAGEQRYEEALRQLAAAAPQRISLQLGFDEALAHRIQAGSDMLLMPSRYEPCGLNQIYALKYGTIPIVRATGGLDDTVENFNPATRSGTGFKFAEYSGIALLAAIDRACGWYRRPGAWEGLVARAMRADFSWERSAAEYAVLYRRLVEAGA